MTLTPLLDLDRTVDLGDMLLWFAAAPALIPVRFGTYKEWTQAVTYPYVIKGIVALN